MWSDRVPGDTAVLAVNNLTIGLGIFTLGVRGRFERNFPTFRGALADPATLDFRLPYGSLLHGAGAPPPVVNGGSLAPAAEFRLPVGTTALAMRESWSPGAFQTPATDR